MSTFYLHGGVTKEFRKLLCRPENALTPVEIHITSYGGSYFAAQDIAKWLRDVSCGSSAVILERAESAAAIIALSCTQRRIVRGGVLVLHLGDWAITGKDVVTGRARIKLSLFEDLVNWHRRWLENRFPLLSQADEFKALETEETVLLSADRALELGLVHQIVEQTE